MAQRQFRSDDTSAWGERFGDGSDGALTISSTTTFSAANVSCSGTSTASTLTLASASTFADGDLLLIHQTRGTGSGNWELNKVASGGGTTTLTLSYPLINTYIDSGASQAQVVELKEYTSVTVDSGFIWELASWDGNVGGLLACVCSGAITINGTINAAGSNGGTTGGNPGSVSGTLGKGFIGGTADHNGGGSGEGTGGAPVNPSGDANGNGGGGSGGSSDNGAGGGNGTAGTSSAAGVGGATAGNAGLTSMVFGGAGGGGGTASGDPNTKGAGGSGAGIVFLIGDSITINNTTGAINLNGGAGGNSGLRDGGGGAGGSCLLKANTITLNTNRITATAGTGGDAGGAGGVGRVHADYGTSITGTSNPTLDSRLDTEIAGRVVSDSNYSYFM